MVFGENGYDSGPKPAKNDGNQEIMRVTSPNSDMVGGIPHTTTIDQVKSKHLKNSY